MKKIFQNLLLVLAGIGVGLLLIEAGLRIFAPQPSNLMNWENFFYHKYDNELGWTTKENTFGVDHPNPQEPAVQIRINSQGYRGQEYPRQKAPGTRRVVILGDSITFGYGVEEKDSYPAILQPMIGAGSQVINRGVSGYGLDQEFLLFQREVLQQRPDLVIVGFSAGDIYDSTCSTRFGIPKPYFKLVNGQLILHRPPAEFSKVNDSDILFRGKPFQAFLFARFHLYRLLFYRFSPIMKKDHVSIEEMTVMEGARVAAAIAKSWKKICDENGVRLLFLVIPQEDWLKNSASSKAFKSGHASAVEILEDAGISYLDLWDPFAANYGQGLFLKGDNVHPNRKGNEIIAQKVRKRLQDDKLL
jgi:lysophospholipase L1-like esterase